MAYQTGARPETADACWSRLDGERTAFMRRVENYASLTIPKILLPEGYDVESTDQTHDYQSIGAVGVKNVANKLMLAMFAPSRPFFKVKAGKAAQKKFDENDMAIAVETVLARIEKQSVAKLDELAQRPKLFNAMKQLVVTGNALMFLDKETIRVMGVRYFCVKRTVDGRIHTLVIRERVKFNELDEEVQAATAMYHSPEGEVDFFKHIVLLPSGNYHMTQWVGSYKLPMKFDGKWTPKKMPYRVLVWDLADESDYGTGLVEEHVADLEAASILSESVVNGGVLAAEFRWLVNPTGLTTADDFNGSENGAALPGRKDDITAANAGSPQALEIVMKVLQMYEQRIGQAFLVGSATIRASERTTAEEVRLTANELEVSFGGVYSTLAPSIQTPIAWWLLEKLDKAALDSDFTVTIVTGLDALSRNGDLENLKQAFAMMAGLYQVPEPFQMKVDYDVTWQFICQGLGIDTQIPFLKSDADVAKARQQAANAQANANVSEAAGTAAAEAQQQPTE